MMGYSATYMYMYYISATINCDEAALFTIRPSVFPMLSSIAQRPIDIVICFPCSSLSRIPLSPSPPPPLPSHPSPLPPSPPPSLSLSLPPSHPSFTCLSCATARLNVTTTAFRIGGWPEYRLQGTPGEVTRTLEF